MRCDGLLANAFFEKGRIFNKDVANMAVMDIAYVTLIMFQAVYDMLKSSGIFVFSTHHTNNTPV